MVPLAGMVTGVVDGLVGVKVASITFVTPPITVV